MNPLTIASLAPTAIQLVQAAKQNKLAKNLKKSNYIPSGVQESEAISRAQANATQLPGQGHIEDEIDQQTSNTISRANRTTKDSSSVMQQVQAADAQSKQALSNISARLADFKLQGQRNLQSALHQKAQYEKQNEDAYNAAKSALKGASAENLFNGISNAASSMLIEGVPNGTTKKKKTAGIGSTGATAVGATTDLDPFKVASIGFGGW